MEKRWRQGLNSRSPVIIAYKKMNIIQNIYLITINSLKDSYNKIIIKNHNIIVSNFIIHYMLNSSLIDGWFFPWYIFPQYYPVKLMMILTPKKIWHKPNLDFAITNQSSILSTRPPPEKKKSVTWAIMNKTLYGQNKHFMDQDFGFHETQFRTFTPGCL